MSLPIHMTVEAESQGSIDGSCELKGREKTILVEKLDHPIHIPTDIQTGLATSKRVHGPLTITQMIDKSTPKLYQSLTTGEHLKTVLLDFYQINKAGKEEKYFTIKLQNAIVVKMTAWFPNALQKENGELQHMMDVSFTYSKIIWTWVTDGIETEDDWSVPTS
jgi:type VI secretion system secreted protein Hcp